MVQFNMLAIFFSLWQHVTFTLLPCLMSFYHGQILIETETDSLAATHKWDFWSQLATIRKISVAIRDNLQQIASGNWQQLGKCYRFWQQLKKNLATNTLNITQDLNITQNPGSSAYT